MLVLLEWLETNGKLLNTSNVLQISVKNLQQFAWELVAIELCSCVGKSRGLEKKLQPLMFSQLFPAGES